MRIIRSADRPLVPAGHENPLAPGVWKRVLAAKADLRPGVVQMINWAMLPVGRGFSPHYHEDMQEVFVIVGGAARLTVGAESAILNRGDAVIIDPREIHAMHNDGHEDVEYLALGITAGTGGQTVVV